MKRDNFNTVKLGIFVTIAFLLFTVAVYYIGNTQNLFGSTLKISSIFNNVKGLQVGNNVRYAGINVGTVSEIHIINDSTIQVDMVIEEELSKFLREDAIASIGSDGLVGNMIVNISPGQGGGASVKEGDVIPSYARKEASDMMNVLGSTTENIALLTVNLLEISERINSGEGSVGKLINDPVMANDFQQAIRNLRWSTENIGQLSKQLEESVNEVGKGQGLMGYLLTDSTLENQINHIAEGVDSLIRDRTQPILTNLETSSEDITKITNKLNNMVEELNMEEGLLGVALKDSLAAENFKQTLRNLNEGTERFNENMEAMKHNFLFRRYFKKQEKKRKKQLKEQKKENVVQD